MAAVAGAIALLEMLFALSSVCCVHFFKSRVEEGLLENGISNPGGRMESKTLAFISGMLMELESVSPDCCARIIVAGGGMDGSLDTCFWNKSSSFSEQMSNEGIVHKVVGSLASNSRKDALDTPATDDDAREFVAAAELNNPKALEVGS